MKPFALFVANLLQIKYVVLWCALDTGNLYLIEGQGTKTYALVKKLIYSDPTFMHALLKNNLMLKVVFGCVKFKMALML